MVTTNLLRERGAATRVTNIELFFDLVYVFAVTQLSHQLLAHPTVGGAVDTAILLAMVWAAWVYTTWVTNFLDPARIPVRAMLVAVMLVSLVMSAALPQAYGRLGLVVGIAYVVMQVGRTVFCIGVLPAGSLKTNFERILAWCLVSGVLAIVGGAVHGHARTLLWLGVVVVDLAGGAAGFYTPGLGRSQTSDWTVDGGHFAERCQAFLLIALGESIVVIGATLSDLGTNSAGEVAAFAAAFFGSVGLWWLYFDRSAEDGAEMIAASADPGALGRSAYHDIHPIMVAGIIVTAAADERVLSHPTAAVTTSTALLVLGGPALFLAGHAAFKATVWKVVPWTRIAAIAVLGLVGVLATAFNALALSIAAALVIVVVAATDRVSSSAAPS